MNKPLPKPSARLQLVRDQEAQGTQTRGATSKSERRVISLDNLVPDPNNERKAFRGLDELAASLKKQGQLEAIIVTPYTDGKYMLISGERRLRAAPMAGLTELEALVRTDVGDKERAFRGITLNLQREDTLPVDRARSLKAMIERFGMTQKELAEQLGKPREWVNQMLRILDLPPRLLEKVGAPTFSPSADTVIRIARLTDTAFQEQLVDALLNGAPQKVIREQIKAHKEVKAGKRSPESVPKPKRVYEVSNQYVLIVQSKTGRYPKDDKVIAFLKREEKAHKARKSK